MPLPQGDDPHVITEPIEPFFPGDGGDAFALTSDSGESSPEPFYSADPESSTPSNESTEGNAARTDDGSQGDPLDSLEFDPKHRLDFEGLLYIGKLTHTFTIYGHRFKIHTLTTDESLSAALLVKTWEGTMGQDRAYITALAAAACESADGRPLYQSIGPNDDEVEGRFNFVRKNWHSWIVDAVYSRLMELESRVQEILDRMGEASG